LVLTVFWGWAGPAATVEKLHLFFLERQEGNLELDLTRDVQHGYSPSNEIFHYQVAYSGLPVGECLIKYKFDGRNFEAVFLSNTTVLPSKAEVTINPQTLLPEKINVVEAGNRKKKIVYDQQNFAVTCGQQWRKLFHPVIEPITLACFFRNFNLAAGRANFLFGERNELFSFDFSKREPVKTAGGRSIYRYLSTPPKITLYLSDDIKKIPVGIIYDLFVGRLELKLKKYQIVN
jgi:hypothetical protein